MSQQFQVSKFLVKQFCEGRFHKSGPPCTYAPRGMGGGGGRLNSCTFPLRITCKKEGGVQICKNANVINEMPQTVVQVMKQGVG